MAYITPNDVPEDGICRPLFIPASTDWLAIFSGALTELTKKYNWEQVEGISVDDAVAAATEVINKYYENVCCDFPLPDNQPVLRLDENGQIQQLVNGEWVEPTGDYELPPTPARTEPTPEERRCLAAANAANALKLIYEEVSDSVSHGESVAETIARVIAVIIGIIGAVFGIVVAPLIILIAGLFVAFTEIAEFLTADLWTETFTDAVRCYFYECSTDEGDVVHFDINCFRNHLAAATSPFELTFDQLRLFGQIDFMINIIGGQGVDAMGATTAVESADCDDCGGWCLEVDFRDNDGGLTALVIDGRTYATYVPGEGWRSNFFAPPEFASTQALAVCLNLPFAASVQKIIWNSEGYGPTNTVDAIFADCILGDFRADDGLWEGDEDWLNMSFYMQWYPDSFATTYIYFRSMSIHGTGTRPDMTGWTLC